MFVFPGDKSDMATIGNPFFWLWLLSAIVSSCYTYIWDIKMDWGLMDKNAGENRFLREETVYRYKVHHAGPKSKWPIAYCSSYGTVMEVGHTRRNRSKFFSALDLKFLVVGQLHNCTVALHTSKLHLFIHQCSR